jgi:hypothetical protein
MKSGEPIDPVKLLVSTRRFLSRPIIASIPDSLADLDVALNSGHICFGVKNEQLV